MWPFSGGLTGAATLGSRHRWRTDPCLMTAFREKRQDMAVETNFVTEKIKNIKMMLMSTFCQKIYFYEHVIPQVSWRLAFTIMPTQDYDGSFARIAI
jgi:hypothetical protein